MKKLKKHMREEELVELYHSQVVKQKKYYKINFNSVNSLEKEILKVLQPLTEELDSLREDLESWREAEEVSLFEEGVHPNWSLECLLVIIRELDSIEID